jgi:hypothetical protein
MRSSRRVKHGYKFVKQGENHSSIKNIRSKLELYCSTSAKQCAVLLKLRLQLHNTRSRTSEICVSPASETGQTGTTCN